MDHIINLNLCLLQKCLHDVNDLRFFKDVVQVFVEPWNEFHDIGSDPVGEIQTGELVFVEGGVNFFLQNNLICDHSISDLQGHIIQLKVVDIHIVSVWREEILDPVNVLIKANQSSLIEIDFVEKSPEKLVLDSRNFEKIEGIFK